MSEKASGSTVMLEFPLFLPELTGVRGPAATAKANRVLHMEHFMVQDIGDDVRRHTEVIELPVEHDLVQCRIETSELRSPYPSAPGQTRLRQGTFEVDSIQPIKERRQVMMLPRWTVVRSLRAVLPK